MSPDRTVIDKPEKQNASARKDGTVQLVKILAISLSMFASKLAPGHAR